MAYRYQMWETQPTGFDEPIEIVDKYAREHLSPDGKYDIVTLVSDLPSDLTIDDRRMYFVEEDSAYHFWNGTEYEVLAGDAEPLTNEQLDTLLGLI